MNTKVILLSALLIFAGCDKKSKINSEKKEADIDLQKNYYGSGTIAVDSTIPLQQAEDHKDPVKQVTAPAPKPDWDKKIIKNASLNLEVKDYNAFSSQFREKIRNFGGYIANEEQSQSAYKVENSIEIKIPVDQFDNAVAQLSNGAQTINEKKISSQDVTGEYVDTRSRMESKKRVRDRYMDLLKQAKNMEEILNVQSEINTIQEEIEAAAGRVEYLGHSSAFSTINMTYYQVLNVSAKDDNKEPALGNRVSNAFMTGLNWFSELLVGLISIWPLLLLAAVLLIIFGRSRTNKPKQA